MTELKYKERNMKAILISIKPKWCELIKQGKKTIEVRKTVPKIKTPFKCYIYCTKGNTMKGDMVVLKGNTTDHIIGNGKVIGEFICDKVIEYEKVNCHLNLSKLGFYYRNLWLPDTCLTQNEFIEYAGDKCYGWHISNLKIYDKPKELSEFLMPCKFKKHIDDYDCLQCDYLVDSDFGGYCGNVVVRPPQSWCYVEVEE